MELLSHQASQAPPIATAVYVRHRPETTLLYQIIEEYWPEFKAELASHGGALPADVTKEFDEHLNCGRSVRCSLGSYLFPDLIQAISS